MISRPVATRLTGAALFSASLAFAACGGGSDGTNATSGDAGGSDSGAGSIDSGSGGKDGSVAIVDSGTDSGISTANCGNRGGQRGLTSRTLTVGGVSRTYLAYIPASADPKTLMPFVFVFHGYSMSGQQMHDITQYPDLADKENIIVVFPDGVGGANSLVAPWNVENSGETVCGAGQSENGTGDDFAFMDAMQADVLQDQCIDIAHVFASGFSMGGYFSHHLACHRPDIRAVAPHSGGTIASLSACSTNHVPIIMFHGTADPLIAPGCDDPNGVAQIGFPASATLWAAKNGCKTTYTTLPTNGVGGGDGQCYLYDGCPADGQVELCTFTGMGHCWAGGSTGGQGAISACPTYAQATQLEWTFFKTYAW